MLSTVDWPGVTSNFRSVVRDPTTADLDALHIGRRLHDGYASAADFFARRGPVGALPQPATVDAAPTANIESVRKLYACFIDPPVKGGATLSRARRGYVPTSLAVRATVTARATGRNG
jgi:hypothetical protein